MSIMAIDTLRAFHSWMTIFDIHFAVYATYGAATMVGAKSSLTVQRPLVVVGT